MSRGAFLFCLVAASLCPAVPARAQEQPPAPRWGVEFVFGGATIDPQDLNAFSLNREAVFGVDYATLYSYYSRSYGQGIALSVTSDGGLPSIDQSRTAGVRVSRRISRRFTAIVGFDYLAQTRKSSMRDGYQLTALNPNAVSFPMITGLSTDLSVQLSVASYSPSLGVRWAFWSPRAFGFEAIGEGGASRATCRIEQQGTQNSTFYSQTTVWSGTMHGTGWHATAEGGVRVNWSMTRRWATFMEGTYRYERFPSITGSDDTQSTRRDGDAAVAEYEAKGRSSGRWRMVPYRATLQGRTVNQPLPAITSDQSPTFALDLSGARLRVGIAFRFGAGGPKHARKAQASAG